MEDDEMSSNETVLHRALKLNLLRKNHLMLENGQIPLLVSDLKTLLPKKYINDRIIDIYLKMMLSDSSHNISFIESSIVSFLLSSLCESAMVRDRVDLTRNHIIMPWCENKHWKMIILTPKEFKFSIVDSLGVKQSSVIKISKFINDNLRLKTERSWNLKNVFTEKQKDGYNCGVFILRYFDRFLGLNHLQGTPDESRKQIFNFLTKNGKISSTKCTNCTKMDLFLVNNDNKKSSKWVHCKKCYRKYHSSCMEIDFEPSEIAECEICSILRYLQESNKIISNRKSEQIFSKLNDKSPRIKKQACLLDKISSAKPKNKLSC